MPSMKGGALVLVALGSGGALSPGSGGTRTLSLDIPFSSSLAGRVPFNSSLAGWVFHGSGEALSLDNRGALSLGIPFNSSLAGWVPFNSSLAGWVFHAFSSRYKLGSMLACTCSAMEGSCSWYSTRLLRFCTETGNKGAPVSASGNGGSLQWQWGPDS